MIAACLKVCTLPRLSIFVPACLPASTRTWACGDRLAPLAAAVDLCILVDSRHLWTQGSVHPSWLPDVHSSHRGGCVPEDTGDSGGVDGLVHPGCHLCLRHVSRHPNSPISAVRIAL